jgi:hypothetical protein
MCISTVQRDRLYRYRYVAKKQTRDDINLFIALSQNMSELQYINTMGHFYTAFQSVF